MWFPFLKFNITVVRFLALAALAGGNGYFHYEDSLPSGIFKHFLASSIFLRASHIPEAVNEVANTSTYATYSRLSGWLGRPRLQHK